jgi:hypothetical protein
MESIENHDAGFPPFPHPSEIPAGLQNKRRSGTGEIIFLAASNGGSQVSPNFYPIDFGVRGDEPVRSKRLRCRQRSERSDNQMTK